jgi:AcrR family transcriptional regulator
MSRRNKDQRREDYLDIGAELLASAAERGASEPGLALAHVKLSDVAELAGVTKGALYHLWPSQEAYWADLLQHLIDSHQLFGVDVLHELGTRLLAELGGAEHDGGTAMRAHADTLFAVLREDPMFFARVSLFSYLDDSSVRASLDEQFRDAAAAALPALELAIRRAGRRVRDRDSLWDLAVSVAALLDGLCLQHRISRDRTPDVVLPDGQRCSLFAIGAEALLVAHTEPDAVGAGSRPAARAVTG